MGGWNRKSVMSPNLLVVDRNKQAGASPCGRATLPISLLYHYYTTNTTTIPQISLLYHSHYHSTVLLCWAPLVHAADRCEGNCLRLFGHRPLASALPFIP